MDVNGIVQDISRPPGRHVEGRLRFFRNNERIWILTMDSTDTFVFINAYRHDTEYITT